MSNATLVTDGDIQDINLHITDARELIVQLIRSDGRILEAAVAIPDGAGPSGTVHAGGVVRNNTSSVAGWTAA